MKKTVWLLPTLLFALCTPASAQYNAPRMAIRHLDDHTVLDQAHLKVTYRLLSVKDPAKPEVTAEDIQVLQIGENISKFYSRYLLEHSEAIAEQLRRNPRQQSISGNPHNGSYGYEVFRNYPEGKVTVTTHDDNLLSTYRYEEASPAMPWTLNDETAVILLYPCRKATTTFRGRHYTAWYTTLFPVDSGPWKFGGLPGLILRLEDAERHYVWECIALERLPTREPIKWYNHPRNPGTDNRYIPISREGLDGLYRSYHKDWVAFGMANGIKMIKVAGGPDSAAEEVQTSPEIPYNPIERE